MLMCLADAYAEVFYFPQKYPGLIQGIRDQENPEL